MTDEQKKSLHHALHSFSGASGRWDERRQRGLTDTELSHAIGFEFGIHGGASGPEGTGRRAWEAKGGDNPRLWIGTGCSCLTLDYNSAPTLKGAALVDAVRQFLEIPQPGQVFSKQLTLF